jgi:hypothetical protein
VEYSNQNRTWSDRDLVGLDEYHAVVEGHKPCRGNALQKAYLQSRSAEGNSLEQMELACEILPGDANCEGANAAACPSKAKARTSLIFFLETTQIPTF